MPEQISFDELKALVAIEDVAAWLGIQTNARHRGECPFCQDDRSFTITPSKGMFGCFKCQRRGSIIDLVHFSKQGPNKATAKDLIEAAKLIQERFLGTVPSHPARDSTVPAEGKSTLPAGGTSTVPEARNSTLPASEGALQPLAHLTTDHPAIAALGLTAAVCAALGIGYAPKGLMRARVVFPLRLPDGTLTGYMGLATAGDQAPLILFPKNLAERAAGSPAPAEKPKQNADDMRKLFRVVA